jgi:signal recognition particle subunit SRP19
MKKRNKLMIWPIYFDSEMTRADGRRVPKKIAIRAVKLEEILKAAENLGLNPLSRIHASYSRKPWIKSGVVLVDKVDNKTILLRMLAQKIRSNRVKIL